MNAPARKLSVRVVSTLYPNHADPGFAPFNRLQLGALSKLVDLRIDNLVPWRFGRPLSRAQTPEIAFREVFDGIVVSHPRYVTIPGLGALNALSMSAALVPSRLEGPRPDVVLGAYAYPDACAAVLMAKSWGVPAVVKCHGSDLNRVSEHRSARLQIKHLVGQADRIMVVSQELGRQAERLGLDGGRVRVIYNGVDKNRFQPRDRDAARAALGLSADDEIVLYVGTLAEHKGALDLGTAAAPLKADRPQARVIMVGDGPAMETLQANPHVECVGRKTHTEVAQYVAACDLLTLPSWGEGLPNVVREAHASGRPVVASRVGGIPEAVAHPELGVLVEAKDPAGLAQALSKVLAQPRADPEVIVERAALPTWEQSAEQLADLLQDAVASP